jgi:hypothetical protein
VPDQNHAKRTAMRILYRILSLNCAVQDGESMRQGGYRMLAVRQYRIGPKGDPRLYWDVH